MAVGTTAEMGNWAKNFWFQNEIEIKLFVLGILSFVLWRIKKNNFGGSKAKLPPGPRNLPVVGAMFSAAKETNIGEWYKKLGSEFGKICYFRLGSHHVIVVSSPEGAEEVLKTKDALLAHRPEKSLLKSTVKYIGFGGEDMIFSSFTENHKNMKKLLTANFFSRSKLALSENIRRREGAFLVEGIQKKIDSEGTVKVGDSILDMGINCICSLIFGKRYSDSLISEGDQLKHFPEIIHGVTTLFLKTNLGDLFPWLAWADIGGVEKEFKEHNKLTERVLGHIVEEHREARRQSKDQTDGDFVDILLTMHEEGKITEKAILGYMLDMIVGGTDTPSTTTEWALLELVKNPDCLAKLQKEIDDVVGKERRVEESDFPDLHYLQAVIHEAFRLHAPAPLLVPHFTEEETTLQGFHVPANTTVFVNQKAITRDPLYWKNPEEFDPERFMNSEKINLTDGKAFNLFPFGSGRRICPAADMGHLLVQRNLSTLVHAFNWSPPRGKTQYDIDRRESVGGLARPETPLLLSATARLAPGIYTP